MESRRERRLNLGRLRPGLVTTYSKKLPQYLLQNDPFSSDDNIRFPETDCSRNVASYQNTPASMFIARRRPTESQSGCSQVQSHRGTPTSMFIARKQPCEKSNKSIDASVIKHRSHSSFEFEVPPLPMEQITHSANKRQKCVKTEPLSDEDENIKLSSCVTRRPATLRKDRVPLSTLDVNSPRAYRLSSGSGNVQQVEAPCRKSSGDVPTQSDGAAGQSLTIDISHSSFPSIEIPRRQQSASMVSQLYDQSEDFSMQENMMSSQSQTPKRNRHMNTHEQLSAKPTTTSEQRHTHSNQLSNRCTPSLKSMELTECDAITPSPLRRLKDILEEPASSIQSSSRPQHQEDEPTRSMSLSKTVKSTSSRTPERLRQAQAAQARLASTPEGHKTLPPLQADVSSIHEAAGPVCVSTPVSKITNELRSPNVSAIGLLAVQAGEQLSSRETSPSTRDNILHQTRDMLVSAQSPTQDTTLKAVQGRHGTEVEPEGNSCGIPDELLDFEEIGFQASETFGDQSPEVDVSGDRAQEVGHGQLSQEPICPLLKFLLEEPDPSIPGKPFTVPKPIHRAPPDVLIFSDELYSTM